MNNYCCEYKSLIEKGSLSNVAAGKFVVICDNCLTNLIKNAKNNHDNRKQFIDAMKQIVGGTRKIQGLLMK